MEKREKVREMGPGPPPDINELGAPEYARRYHHGGRPSKFLFKLHSKVLGHKQLKAHLCDLVDDLSDIYPALKKSVCWYTCDSPESKRGGLRTYRQWDPPKIGNDILVPDHVSVDAPDGGYDHYVISMMSEKSNLHLGNIRRSMIRGFPIEEP